MKTILATLLLLLCFSGAAAQSKAAKAESSFDKYFGESSAQYWAGVALDYCSSLNKHEANPLFQNRQGQISGVKFFSINAGIYAATVALQNKYPRLMNWTRRIHGWIHFGVSAHNFTIPQRR